ncbi:MAG: HPr(Ser) kinase/phosphatase [Proteobacteria bacterium]|nr:HPr(Ser) kinase/phosphatase [Pseudomonadota bacterium]
MELILEKVFSAEQCEKFGLTLHTGGAGLKRKLTTPHIQKPGLLLTGLLDELHSDRIQIFGSAEVRYLLTLTPEKLDRAMTLLTETRYPAIIVTRSLEVPPPLFDFCTSHDIPLYVTTLTTSVLIEDFTNYLNEILAPTVTIHGVLADVLGVGVLILGDSGIGKSECALDLVVAGYRLVSDDAVIIKRLPPHTLFGMASDVVKYHIEIRGLGIVNIKDLYGITAIRERKQMDIVVELVKWESDEEYERLGFEDKTYDILGVDLPYMKVPVTPGRSVATIVEVAARNQILKIMGQQPGRELLNNIDSAMHANRKNGQ